MLNTLSKGAFAIAAAASFMAAAPAQAETVNVLIMEEAYFPSVVYVKPGDTLTFSNESGVEHTVNGQDDEWTTGPIAAGADTSVTIDQSTHVSFSGLDVAEVEISADLNYGEPPLAD